MLARARPGADPRVRRRDALARGDRCGGACRGRTTHLNEDRMLLPIRILGDPVLREPAKPVERFDRALRQLAADMTATMYEAPGVGLAGPQVGISMQLFVFDDGEHGPMFM